MYFANILRICLHTNIMTIVLKISAKNFHWQKWAKKWQIIMGSVEGKPLKSQFEMTFQFIGGVSAVCFYFVTNLQFLWICRSYKLSNLLVLYTYKELAREFFWCGWLLFNLLRYSIMRVILLIVLLLFEY